MNDYIKYTRNGNVIKIECNALDKYGDGERLCESVLGGADWAETIDCGVYKIEDAEQMACLVEFLEAYNAQAERNVDAITDWTLLI